MFQDELIHAQKYVADRADVTNGVKVYKVHEFSREKPIYMTKDAKKNDNMDIIQNEIANKFCESSTLLFNSIMLHSLGLSEKASRLRKHYDLAVSSIKNLCDELDKLTIDLVDEGKKSTSSDDSKMVGNDVVLYNDITLKDLIHVITKGLHHSLRKKISVEKNNKNSETCSSCNRKGHTKHTCERRQPSK
ncbi:hypothetical protein V6N12_025626 [Hibiscus sabdariffa]|uniref:CCHC-type domain-containing protein n=1 Tax=Hibiscus sabdariffa TaxID=183260 RepID=A0ABR2CJ15_9ROSI